MFLMCDVLCIYYENIKIKKVMQWNRIRHTYIFFKKIINALFILYCTWYALALMLGQYIIHMMLHCMPNKYNRPTVIAAIVQAGLFYYYYYYFKYVVPQLQSYTSVLSAVTFISMFCCYSWQTIQQTVMFMFLLKTEIVNAVFNLQQ